MRRIVLSANTTWYIYNFRRNLIKELQKKDFEVYVVSPKDDYFNKLTDLGCHYYDIYIDNKSTNPFKDLKTVKEYYNLYKEIKPDIALHFTIKPNIYGNFACKLLKIPVINNVAGLGTTFIKRNITTFLVKKMYKIAFKDSFVFFQNNDDKELFLKEKIISQKNIDVLPGSGVDINKFRPINIEKEDKTFRFLLIARMLWDKGIGEYVEAAKIIKEKYNNVEFCLLGAIWKENPSAISEEQIKKWELEGIVKYLGVREDVREEIAKADCIVLPSYYREGVPRSLLEAAAMEKPIITTDHIGCKEVVEDGINGFLCRLRDPLDLANKMEKMLNLAEEERIKMGKRGREKVVREFDERIVIRKYMNKIDILLGNNLIKIRNTKDRDIKFSSEKEDDIKFHKKL